MSNEPATIPAFDIAGKFCIKLENFTQRYLAKFNLPRKIFESSFIPNMH